MVVWPFCYVNASLINLSIQGAITKRMTAIEEMAGMDVLCSDKTGTLTLNKLTVDKFLIEVRILEFSPTRDCSYTCSSSRVIFFCLFLLIFQVFARDVDADTVVLMAARASRTENQDAIDAAIVGMLADPKEVTLRIVRL